MVAGQCLAGLQLYKDGCPPPMVRETRTQEGRSCQGCGSEGQESVVALGDKGTADLGGAGEGREQKRVQRPVSGYKRLGTRGGRPDAGYSGTG